MEQRRIGEVEMRFAECERRIFKLEKDLIKAKISRSVFQRIESNVVSAYMTGENAIK